MSNCSYTKGVDIQFSPDVVKANQAYESYKNGDIEKSLKVLEAMASKGNPDSFAVFCWHLALSGEHDKSIEFFNKYENKMKKWIDEELENIQKIQYLQETRLKSLREYFEYSVSNTKSNVAISFKAKRDETKALELWNEAVENHKHIEAKFFLLLNQDISILSLKNMIENYGFVPSQIVNLIFSLKSAEEVANGWSKEWFAKALDALRPVEEELIYSQKLILDFSIENTPYCYNFIDEIIVYAREYKSYLNNKSKQNFEKLKIIASNGFPNMFSTVTWILALNGDFEEAIKFYNQYEKQMQIWLSKELEIIQSRNEFYDWRIEKFNNIYSYQISNSKSNAGVSFKAVGDESRAIELWNEAASNHKHLEARFYLILSKNPLGLDLSTMISEHNFNVEEILTLNKDLNSIIDKATGWFKLWGEKGLNALKKVNEEIKMLKEISEILDLSLTQENFFQELFIENSEVVKIAILADAILKDLIKPNKQLILDLKNSLTQLQTYYENIIIDKDDEDELDDEDDE